ncbi:MAG: Ig-like domain-containing protein [Clostridia bacterium]|nr:Ig-like domain-containing protein [Clostridia bacterium]
MKKIFKSSLSLLLSALMIFSVAPAFAFAADEVVEGEVAVEGAPAPSFVFEKVSETETEVVMALNLKENSFNCFELQITTKDELVLKAIDVDSSFSSKTSNCDNGMIAIATLEACTAPFTVATYTYDKLNKISVLSGDFNLSVATCYVGEEDNETDVTEGVTITVDLPAEHIHVPGGSWVMTVQPTCGAEGTVVRYCTECGEVAETEPVDKTEHKNIVKDHKDATCTEAGFDKETCNDCGAVVSDVEIPATNHKNTTKEDVPPTCTEKGYHKETCNDCGVVVSYSETAETGHRNQKNEHKDPTCAEPGYDRIVCEDCGAVISSDEIPVTEHKNKDVERKEPTCTEAGYVKTFCTDCKTVLSTDVLPATNHKNTKTEHKDPTCTEAGYDKVICNDCGAEVSKQDIPVLPHKAVDTVIKDAECLEDGYVRTVCSCGHIITEKVLEATGHNYYDDIHPATCTEDGYRRKVCRYCQDIQPGTTSPATGHKWLAWTTIKEPTVSAEGIKRRICDNCGADEEKSIPKLVVNAKEVVLTTEEVSMNYDQTLRLFANVLPEDAAYSTVIYWESSNPDVATVDEEGQVHATGVGTATITAKTANGKSDTCTVTVKYSIIQWIIVYVLFGWIWYL